MPITIERKVLDIFTNVNLQSLQVEPKRLVDISNLIFNRHTSQEGSEKLQELH